MSTTGQSLSNFVNIKWRGMINAASIKGETLTCDFFNQLVFQHCMFSQQLSHIQSVRKETQPTCFQNQSAKFINYFFLKRNWCFFTIQTCVTLVREIVICYWLKLEFFACLAFHKEIIIKLIINKVCTLILEQWSVISQKPVEKVLIIHNNLQAIQEAFGPL